MKTVAIGGNSREVGKTSLAASLIGATPELAWTAVKVTQFGHGICSSSGGPCDCAVDDPECPFEISVDDGSSPKTDTARMLAAGAAEALWVRVALGQLPAALPAIRQRLAGKGHVLFESNSLVEHWPPDLYLSVLDCSVEDCKHSALRLAASADAFVLPKPFPGEASWSSYIAPEFDRKPAFAVSPPSFCSAEIIDFAKQRLV